MECKTQEGISLCEKHKSEGNARFKEQKLPEAVESYTLAVKGLLDILEDESQHSPESHRKLAIYFSNRAAVHLKMENCGLAIMDAEEAINYDPSYPKAYYRKADGLISIDKYKDARACLKIVVFEMKVQDKDAQEKYKFVQKAIKQRAFEDAIQSEQGGAADCDPTKLEVEESYNGPRLEEETLQKGLSQELVVELMDYMVAQKKLHKKYLWNLLIHIRTVLKKKASLVDWTVPQEGHFTVCGDTHGQYYDMVNIFKLNGLPSHHNPYLFNGDFVDRGSFSVEVITLLFAFMAMDPRALHLTRGNHEAKNMNKLYGFEGEVQHKYDTNTYDLFCDVFCHLPLSYVLNKTVMITHGGLFKEDGVLLDDIRKVDRRREPPDAGIMCDLLWADPSEKAGRTPSQRGISVGFGADVSKAFLDQNGLSLLVRSHEMKKEGYEVAHDGRVVTIFSAPNYCD